MKKILRYIMTFAGLSILPAIFAKLGERDMGHTFLFRFILIWVVGVVTFALLVLWSNFIIWVFEERD